MTEHKLKPCPFCGAAAEMQITPRFPQGDWFAPRCTNKSCCGRAGKKFTTPESAVYSWNRRAKG